eukprot:1671291-Prorocentrum_lima.AAC.1
MTSSLVGSEMCIRDSLTHATDAGSTSHSHNALSQRPHRILTLLTLPLCTESGPPTRTGGQWLCQH